MILLENSLQGAIVSSSRRNQPAHPTGGPPTLKWTRAQEVLHKKGTGRGAIALYCR